jgi:hypothetical protein
VAKIGLWLSLLLFTGKPVRPFRHINLKACTFAAFPGLFYRDAGNRQDLPGEEKAKPVMFPETAFEEMLFVFGGYSDPVISNGDNEPGSGWMMRYAYMGDCASMLPGII